MLRMRMRVLARRVFCFCFAAPVLLLGCGGGSDGSTGPSGPPVVASVSVTGANAITIGQSIQLNAIARDETGRPIDGRAATWVTNSTATASVSATGVVTGIAPGSATITATIEGKTGEASVSVVEVTVTSIALEVANVTLAAHQVLKLSAVARDGSGAPIPANFISWSTSNPGVVASRSDGSLEGLTQGTATVTASAGGKSASAQARVVAFSSIAAGSSNICALTAEGVLYCAGARFTDRARPTWTDIRWAQIDVENDGAEAAYGCGVTTAGAVMCWGNNSVGELGVGDFENRNSPSLVPLSEHATQVTAGGDHACALMTSGTIYCWGDNSVGQLGNGSTVNSPIPVLVGGSDRFVQVSAGGSHTCALDNHGVVLCWGRNRLGELGRGTWSVNQANPTPAPVESGVQYKAVDLTASHSCAVAFTGDAYCWGANTVFELGQANVDLCDGGHPCGIVPRQVSGGKNFQDIATSGFGGCGVADGTSYCWGMDTQSTLGTTSTVPFCPAIGANAGCTATPLPGTSSLKTLSGGRVNYCGIRTDGGAYCWGGNKFGQLGVPSLEETAIATIFAVDPAVTPP